MKIIGSGLIASAFASTELGLETTLFASGVSNSQEIRSSEYERETNLLQSSLAHSKKLIYFSTCSVTDPHLSNTPYVSHKLSLEKLVLTNKNNIIIRLPQVVGICRNRNTLTNFLAYKIFNEEAFDLFEGSIKSIIDIEDVVKLTNYIFQKRLPENLYSFNLPINYEVSQIVSCLESILGKSSIHTLKKGHRFKYSNSVFISNAISKNIIDFNYNYLQRTLIRVYANYPNGFQ